MIPMRAPVALVLLAAATVAAGAQTSMSEAFRGFGGNTRDPVQIEADALEVHDKEAYAVFTGNVLVKQSDTVLKTQRLKVFYESGGNGQPAGPGQQIRRFEAEGRLSIQQGDQSVTGETGWFDMRADKAQLGGGVVLTQGKNVARGERLAIDLKSGQYRLESGKGRVQLTIEPQSGKGGRP